MGVTAKPFGKFGGIMRKVHNEQDAQAYTMKHLYDDKKKDKKKEDTVPTED